MSNTQVTPPGTLQGTPTGEPGENPPAKPKIKIMKNENGTFRADDLQFKINSMNDSTITLISGDKKYKIGKNNNTYTIDGVTFQIQSSNIQTQPNGSMMVNVHLAPSVEQVPTNNAQKRNKNQSTANFVNVTKPQSQPLIGGKKRASRKMRPSKMSKRLKTRRVT